MDMVLPARDRDQPALAKNFPLQFFGMGEVTSSAFKSRTSGRTGEVSHQKKSRDPHFSTTSVTPLPLPPRCLLAHATATARHLRRN